MLMRVGSLSLSFRADSFGRRRVVHAVCVGKPDNHIMFLVQRSSEDIFVDKPEPHYRGSRWRPTGEEGTRKVKAFRNGE